MKLNLLPKERETLADRLKDLLFPDRSDDRSNEGGREDVEIRRPSGMKLNLLPETPTLTERLVGSKLAVLRTAGAIAAGAVAISLFNYATTPNDDFYAEFGSIDGLGRAVEGSLSLKATGSKINPRHEVEELTFRFLEPGDYTLQLVVPQGGARSNSELQGLSIDWSKRIKVTRTPTTVVLSQEDGLTPQSVVQVSHAQGSTDLSAAFFNLRDVSR